MTLRFLLDTSTVSSPISRKPNPTIVQQLDAHGHQCAIAAPVWYELTYGCRHLPPSARRSALEAYLNDVVRASFPVLPYDDAAATWHAIERVRLEVAGTPPPYVDGQIAAIAGTTGLILVTVNVKHFTRFNNLDVIDWSRRKRGR